MDKLIEILKQNEIEPTYGMGEMPIGMNYHDCAVNIVREYRDQIRKIPRSLWQEQSNK